MAQSKKTQAEDNGHASTEEGIATINGLNDLPKELQPDPNYVATYDFRRLHSGDTWKVYKWIRAAQAEDQIRDAAERGGLGAAQYEVVDVLLGKLEDEVVPWLYDLAGIGNTDEEDLPADAPIAVVTDLLNHPDFLRVFASASRASHAIKRISSLFAIPQDSQEQAEDSQTENS